MTFPPNPPAPNPSAPTPPNPPAPPSNHRPHDAQWTGRPWENQPQHGNPNPYMELLKNARRDFSRVGVGLSVLVVLWLALAMAVSAVLYLYLGVDDLPNWGVYVSSSLPLYFVAMPIVVLIMRKVSTVRTQRFDMKPGMFFKLLVMCFPIMCLGSIIGTVCSMAASGGQATNRVSELALTPDVWNVVFMVVLGPFFEEWMFRKQLIDHTRKYGEKTAILISAVAFGLFHLNMFQFFYAFGLGLIFGYVYMRTSKLRYSVAMHMLINFNGGVLVPWIFSNMDFDSLEAAQRNIENGQIDVGAQWISQNMGSMTAFCVYFLAYFVLIVVGAILLIRERRNFEFYTAPEELPKGMRVKAVLGNVGAILFVLITMGGTLYYLL